MIPLQMSLPSSISSSVDAKLRRLRERLKALFSAAADTQEALNKC